MTQDEIIRMARDADKDFAIALIALEQITPFLERFAAIVAAHEREACAKLAYDLRFRACWTAEAIAEAIRARG